VPGPPEKCAKIPLIGANNGLMDIPGSVSISEKEASSMKLPRWSIAGLMTLVVFVAANCAIVKAIMARPSVWNEVFILGTLPMANLLAVSLLPTLSRRQDRAGIGGFRLGFEVCGMLAMVAFFALSLQYTDHFFLLPQTFFSEYVTLRPGLGLVSAAVVIFFGPQLAIALLGGGIGRFIGDKMNAHAIINAKSGD
jgi:hypothetical protein